MNTTKLVTLSLFRAHIQDAYHFALLAQGGAAARLSAFDTGRGERMTADEAMVKAVQRAAHAGVAVDGYTRRTLARMLATAAAARGVDAFTGERVRYDEITPEAVESILASVRGFK